MWAEYRAHVEALATWDVEPSGRRPLEWSPHGVDMPLLRKVQRQEHQGRASCFLVNYPGLVAAIPSRAFKRRPGVTGLAGLTDDQVAREISIASAMRGRGLSSRAVSIVDEFLHRCATVKFWLCRDNAVRVPEMSRAELAALTDVPLSRVARGVLGMLRGARKARRWGLEYSNEQAALVLGCDESTVRRAMRELEANGLAWRLVMWREGVGRRPVDQHENVLLPGPQWMATVDAALTGTDSERLELEEVGASLHCKRRYIEAQRRGYRRRCRRARERNEEIPDPPGSVPVSFADWWEARALAEDEIAAIRDEVEDVDRRVANVGVEDARAFAAGELGAAEVLERQTHRDAERAAIARQRDEAMAHTTPERLAAAPVHLVQGDGAAVEQAAERAHLRALNSNWVGGLPTRSVPSLKAKEKEEPPTTCGRPALLRGLTHGRPADPREQRGGDWYDQRWPAPPTQLAFDEAVQQELGPNEAALVGHSPPGLEPAAGHLATKGTHSAQKVAGSAKILAESGKSRWCDFDAVLREMKPNFLKGQKR
jgi:hypothetical protein